MENIFIQVLRGANILAFFGAILAAFLASRGMPALMVIFTMLGTLVGAAIWCGVIALFMQMNDRLGAQVELLDKLVKRQAPVKQPSSTLTQEQIELRKRLQG